MGKASDWLREERRNVLGHWVAVCVACGHGQRYFEESEDEVTACCPQCGAAMLQRCPACAARLSSMFAVECEVCEAPLRPPSQFGKPIRRPAAKRRATSS